MDKTELIKTIEAHRKGECHKCPYEGLPRCFDILCENTVKLINRLDEENELLHATRKDHFNRAQGNAIMAMGQRVKQAICDNTYPDFNKDGKPVNVWNAKTGYDAIDQVESELLEAINGTE